MLHFLTVETGYTQELYQKESIPLTACLDSTLSYSPTFSYWLDSPLLLQGIIFADHFAPSILLLVWYLIQEMAFVDMQEPYQKESIPITACLDSTLSY